MVVVNCLNFRSDNQFVKQLKGYKITELIMFLVFTVVKSGVGISMTTFCTLP